MKRRTTYRENKLKKASGLTNDALVIQSVELFFEVRHDGGPESSGRLVRIDLVDEPARRELRDRQLLAENQGRFGPCYAETGDKAGRRTAFGHEAETVFVEARSQREAGA